MNPRMLRLPVGGLYSGKDEAFDQHVPYDTVAVRTNRPREFASSARISASKELMTGRTYVATETFSPRQAVGVRRHWYSFDAPNLQGLSSPATRADGSGGVFTGGGECKVSRTLRLLLQIRIEPFSRHAGPVHFLRIARKVRGMIASGDTH